MYLMSFCPKKIKSQPCLCYLMSFCLKFLRAGVYFHRFLCLKEAFRKTKSLSYVCKNGKNVKSICEKIVIKICANVFFV